MKQLKSLVFIPLLVLFFSAMYTSPFSSNWSKTVAMTPTGELRTAHLKATNLPFDQFVKSMEKNGWVLVDPYAFNSTPVPFASFVRQSLGRMYKGRQPYYYYNSWTVSVLFQPCGIPPGTNKVVSFRLSSYDGVSRPISVELKSKQVISLLLRDQASRPGNSQEVSTEIINSSVSEMKTFLLEEQIHIVDRQGTELIRGYTGVITTKTFQKKE